MKRSSHFLLIVAGGSLVLVLLLCLWLPREQVERPVRADKRDLFTQTSIDPSQETNTSSGNQESVRVLDRCRESERFSGSDGQLRCASLTPSEVNGVQNFVLFIGYARSGHSIVGSMMDAHPNMIIAHEYFLFRKFPHKYRKFRGRTDLFNELLGNSCSSVVNGWRSNMSMKGAARKGYALALPTQWQGCFTDLKVIGDKSGGCITDSVTKNPVLAKSTMRIIQKLIRLPVLLIHIVRNPFDMIATEVMNLTFVGMHRWEHLNRTARALPDPDQLERILKRYQQRAVSIQQVQEEWGIDILEIHHADFVHNPKRILQDICDYLHLDCPEDYLEACYNKTFKTISKSRYLMEWPPHAVSDIEKMIQEYSFFRRYSFDSD